MHTHAGSLVERRCGPCAVSRPQALARGNRAVKPQAWACCLGPLGASSTFTVAACAGMAADVTAVWPRLHFRVAIGAAVPQGVAHCRDAAAMKRPVRIHCSGKWWCAQPMRGTCIASWAESSRVGKPSSWPPQACPSIMASCSQAGSSAAATSAAPSSQACATAVCACTAASISAVRAFAMRQWRLHRAPAAIARHRSRWRLPRASARSCHRSKPLRSMRRHQAACAHRPRARPAPARLCPRRCTQWHRRSRSAGVQQRSDTRSAGPAESEYLPAQDHP